MREISVTLVISFGNDDPGEAFSDAEIVEALVEDMSLEPIEIETPDAESTFEIIAGKLN